jgi:hypothetical protein
MGDLAKLPRWLLAIFVAMVTLFLIYSFWTGAQFNWRDSIGFKEGFSQRLRGATLSKVGPFTVGSSTGWDLSANNDLALSAVDTKLSPTEGFCYLIGVQGPLGPNEKAGFDTPQGTYRLVLWVGKNNEASKASTSASAECVKYLQTAK